MDAVCVQRRQLAGGAARASKLPWTVQDRHGGHFCERPEPATWLLANAQRVASGPSYQMTLYDTLGRIYSAGLRYNS